MRGKKIMIDTLLNSRGFTHKFWVCEYQRNGGLGKIMRNVKPTYVEILLDDYDLERIFKANNEYDKYNIVPTVYTFKRDGNHGKRISYYGTTAGDEGLYFFETENEAVKQYNNLIFAYIESIKEEKEKTAMRFDKAIEELQEGFVKSDYVMELLVRSHGGRK